METEQMYYLDKFCCICMNKNYLKHLFEVDSDGVSHYNKLTSSIAEMNFKEMNDQRLICAECCITLNTVYNFRQMCLRSKTNLITHTSQQQTSDHIGSNPQIKFHTEENIGFPASVKEECEIGDDSSAHEDATVDHVNEGAHSDVKVEDVEQQIMMEDYSEYYVEFNKIEIEEDPLAVVKEEPMSDTETPQDVSTSQADTGTSEEPKRSEVTTIETELTHNIERDNEGLHQCEICQKCFNRISLMNHMQTHTSEKSYECEICEKNFNVKSNLINHMQTHHGETVFQCEICNKGFTRKHSLVIHKLIHANERLYQCEICKKGFNNKWNLTGHMTAHSSEKPYECEICKKGFKNKSYVNVHMKTHSSERPYKCEICKRGYNHKFNLTEHMKTHISENPYECEICKKGFKHKSNFTKHMNSHSSERLYECEICKKDFYQKNNLTRHMKTHFSEKPHECEICKKRFDKKTSCIRHMKRHSDEKS